MNLKADFRKDLLSGASHDDLIKLVLEYKSAGVTQRVAYDQLHELWLELGFNEDESNRPDPQRDELEYVIELVGGVQQR